MLADGISRIIQYILDPHAQIGFAGLLLTSQGYDLFGWFGTAVLLIVGIPLFRLREFGRYYTAYWLGIYLAFTLLTWAIILLEDWSSGIKDLAIRINFFGWNQAIGGIFGWLLALITYILIPAAVLCFLSVPETRATFRPPAREIPAMQKQEAGTQDKSAIRPSQ